MACRYIYKGHEFASELALDDFLLTDRNLESILGDAVFSATPELNSVTATIEVIRKDTEELLSKYKEWRENDKSVKYGEDGETDISEPPYIGVNRFLSGLTDEDGKLLFPEFREEEYWKLRKNDWKKGNFNDNEIETFGLDKNNLKSVTDEELLNNYVKLMTYKWKILAKTGTAIHNVLLLFFEKTNGEYNYLLSDSDLEALIWSKIEYKNRLYLNNSTVKQAIKYARNLHKNLIERFGDDLAFYPEFCISQQANYIGKTDTVNLLGIIDLLIVDNKGHVHILDYKTSIHDYNDFSRTKKTAYSYLIVTYLRMLEKYGINIYESKLMVSPIQIKNFRRSGDTYIYDGIESSTPFIVLNTTLNSLRMWDNINEFMPAPFKLSISAKDLGLTVSTLMAKWFPSYSSIKLADEKDVIRELKDRKLLEPDENGVYTYKKYGYNEAPITATSEAEFVLKVLKYKQSLPASRLRYTSLIKDALRVAMKNGIDEANFPDPIIKSSEGDTLWLKSTLSKYCDGNWEIIESGDSSDLNLDSKVIEAIESYGLIIVKTKAINGIAPQIDFIRVSTNNLTANFRRNLDSKDPLKNRKSLVGTYESDVLALSKSVGSVVLGNNQESINTGNLMAEAVNGNVEIMETMLIINLLTGILGFTVGNILVVNPLYANGVLLSNELALYCFNELNKHDSVPINNFNTGEIKLATKYELVRLQFNHIMIAGNEHKWKDGYKNFETFKSSISVLDLAIDGAPEEKIEALYKLLRWLNKDENNMKTSLSKTYTSLSDLQLRHIALLNAILTAIAQLKGVNFRLQLKDHDKWLESVFIHRNGVSGTYLDNPGNLDSDTLNLVTRLITEAYQNTRDEMLRNKLKVRKLVENLKKSKGFGAISENTIGNQASLYSNLYEETSDGDLLFKRLDKISDSAERELLQFALREINSRRYPEKIEMFDEAEANGDTWYYQVPLAIGGLDSIASVLGMMSVLRAKLSYLNPKTAFERAQKKVEGVFNAAYDIEEDDEHKSLLLYQMTNLFDLGLKETRIDKIKAEGILNFERNLETLLLKHMFAYSVLENVDTVFPMIRAAMIHITLEGAMRNKPFKDDIKYLEDYIKNKILNQSIVNAKTRRFTNIANLIKQAASKLTLAFAPVLMFYQPLQGLWQDISLMIRKPDGKDSFTFKHFLSATKLVYRDLFHYSDKPTLCSALNELYGINDMDMNTYVDRISTAKKGIWNFENFMFKFASRPDYYNRMTIFTSQMMSDECLDAHHIDTNGNLIYDWKLDERYRAFALNPTGNSPEVNKARALYYAAALLFVREHARNADGSLFELNMSEPMALPRAYTNKLAEGMKSLGDDIYGYYSHEKKSLVMSTALGSLWLQFKTYWSGKKNQYLQSGGVRLRGDWKHYEENGLKYYYQVDADGKILYDKPPTTEITSAPVYQWEGLWQEGIILTLSDMVKSMWDNKSIIKGFNSKWNEADEKLRVTYRSNIKLLGYDFIMFALVGSILGALLGDWLDELKKDSKKNKDFTKGLGISAAQIAVMSVKNSFLDLNFIESIGSPIGQWTPFAFEWQARFLKNWWNVAMGDEDFWDGVVRSSGSLKQIKPALDSIKPNMFRTEREGGTWTKGWGSKE